jgi:hypothetical protein
VSVGGFSTRDYVEVCEQLEGREAVAAIELNLSCPNVDEVPENVGEVVAAARAATSKPLYAKLSPAIGDLAETARAAEAAGADGLSLVNTIKGLALDERTLQPVLARGAGGLSGPAWAASRPVATCSSCSPRALVTSPSARSSSPTRTLRREFAPSSRPSSQPTALPILTTLSGPPIGTTAQPSTRGRDMVTKNTCIWA